MGYDESGVIVGGRNAKSIKTRIETNGSSVGGCVLIKSRNAKSIKTRIETV